MKIWAARDKDGTLNLFFRQAPRKMEDFWDNSDDWCECPDADDIPSIQWEDAAPTPVKYDKNNTLIIAD